MKLKDIFTTASSNMLRSKLRSFLTIIAIFIGSLTLTLTTGIGAGINSYIDKQLGNIGAKDVLIVQGVDPSASSASDPNAPQKYSSAKKTTAEGPGITRVLLTESDLSKIRSHSGIRSVAPSLLIAVDYVSGPSNDKFQLAAQQNLAGTNLDLASGSKLDDNSLENQIIIPVGYVTYLGFKNNQDAIDKIVALGISDPAGQVHTINAIVTGPLQKGLIGGGPTLNKHLALNLYNIQTQGLPVAATQRYFSAVARFDSSLSDSQLTQLKSNLLKDGYQAQTLQDALGTFKQIISIIIDVLDFFAIIALLAASFGIINTLLMSVQERTKEIGLMKAMGMRSSRIFLLFSTEAAMIGFWGSLLGIIIAFVLGTIADNILSNGLLKGLPGLQIVAFPIQGFLGVMFLIMFIAFLRTSPLKLLESGKLRFE